MYRSWQDCCRRGENRSWPSVSVESVDSEYWYLNNVIVYAFIMRLTVEERVLRSTFKLNTLYKKCVGQELTKIEISPKKSGAGADDVYQPKLAWFKRADIFLKYFVPSKTITSNLCKYLCFITQFLIISLHSFIDQW